MKPERLARRWQRRHQKLLSALRRLHRLCRRRGDAEQVHELRVTLRRLRLSVRLGKALFDAAQLGQLRAWAGRISRATSPVRDLDIAVEWLVASKAGPALVAECQTLRDRLWRRRQRQLLAIPGQVLGRLAHPAQGGTKAAARALARRFCKLQERYRDHVRQQLPRFFQLGEEDRHDFRRTVRWWRYLRELAVSRKKLPKDPVCRRLLPAQEALGELQNLALVQAILRRLTPSPERDELRALLARQQQAQLYAARQALKALKAVLH